MLISYSVSNVLSFLEPVTLNLIETRKTKRHPTHVVEDAGVRVLRSAMISGPNAAGKSNLFRTLALFIKAFSRNDCRSLAESQFRLGDGKNRIMRWELVFSNRTNLFRYAVESDGESVVRETLVLVADREEVVFNRDETGVHLGDVLRTCSWFDEKVKLSAFYLSKLYQDGLFEIDQNDEQAVRLVRSALSGLKSIEVLPADAELRPESLGRHFKIREFQTFLLKLMQNADLGIRHVLWNRLPSGSDIENFVKMSFPKGVLPQEALKFYRFGDSYVAAVVHNRQLELYELQCEHSGKMLRAANESDGTLKILNYSVFLYSMLLEPKTWVVDELDRGLHPDLTQFIVRQALVNPNAKSQLIFTAHDVTLKSLDIFRADEIWFVSKTSRGATRLYSLYQFKPRHDVDVEKRYREGMWGGRPNVGSLIGGDGHVGKAEK